MRKFTISFSCENAAFDTTDDPAQEEREIARVLRDIADKVERGEEMMFYQTIRDVNGNDIGRFKLIDQEV